MPVRLLIRERKKVRTIAETLRIEIPIETVDKTEPELSNLIRKLGNLGTTAERTGTSSQRAGERVSQFDRQAQKTEKGLAKWAKEKYGRLEAKLDKELVDNFKIYLQENNLKYQEWLKNKIKGEL